MMSGREIGSTFVHFTRLAHLGEHPVRLFHAWETRAQGQRFSEGLPGRFRIPQLVVRHPQVILDLGVVRELGGTLPYQAEGPLIDATLVEDPSQGIGDVWVLWGRHFGGLRELERLPLAAAVLAIEPGEVVSRGGEARLSS